MDSPKTPTQATFDDSFDDEDSDEMESPKFPHLIPIYHRRDDDYDLRDVRIGWDDGYGSVFFDDDDYGKVVFKLESLVNYAFIKQKVL